MLLAPRYSPALLDAPRLTRVLQGKSRDFGIFHDKCNSIYTMNIQVEKKCVTVKEYEVSERFRLSLKVHVL